MNLADALETLTTIRDEYRAAHDIPAGIGAEYGMAADEMETALQAIRNACTLAGRQFEFPNERARLISHLAARIDRDAQTLASLRGLATSEG